jgi:translation initiation factor 3 subunit L
MSLYQRTPYQQADAQRLAEDVDDQDEEAMVNDYREQVHFDDNMSDLERTTSMSALPDMQAQLLAAATPLEYPASLETKFQSYDSYCNLFHYVLNSNGPVDIEAPSVRGACRL